MKSYSLLSFIVHNWMLCAIYTVIIITLNIISILYAAHLPFLNYLLFLIGFSVSSGFIIVCSEIFHNKKLENPIRDMIIGKNKLRWEIVTYFIFVAIIFIPMKLLALAASLFPWSQILITNIQTQPTYSLLFGIILAILYAAYKSVLFIGLANLIHNNDEVISSLTYGLTNMIRFFVVLLVILLNSVLYSFAGYSDLILNKLIIGSISYLLPGYLVIYIFTKFRPESALFVEIIDK